MKKTVFILILLLAVLILNTQTTDFYSLTAKTIDGKDFSFEQLRGKRVLIVNVASKCGYTKQYKELQELHEKYGSEKFIMLGFPANNFLKTRTGQRYRYFGVLHQNLQCEISNDVENFSQRQRYTPCLSMALQQVAQ